MVGVPDDDQLNTITDSGTVYVYGYDSSAGSWVQIQKLLSGTSGHPSNLEFGRSSEVEGTRALIVGGTLSGNFGLYAFERTGS